MSRTRLIVSAILIVILGLFSAPASWAGGLKLPATTVTLAAGYAGYATVLADVNADGKTDLVVAECKPGLPNSGQVEIFQGDGSGGFTLKATVSLGTACPYALAVGHLSAVTVPEIVIGDDSGAVTVVQDDGTKTFTFNTLGPYAVGAFISGVAIADMDKDTNPDVVATDATNNQFVILLGDGTGNLGTVLAPSLTASGPYAVGTTPTGLVVADFNNDGYPDVATANNGDGTVSVVTNNKAATGDVTFVGAPGPYPVTTAGTAPISITAGNLTTVTNFPDIAVVNATSANVSVMLNDGTGAFPSATNVNISGTSPTGITLGNFSTHTTNPQNDIVVSASDGADILFNDGTGTFTNANYPAQHFAAGSNPNALSVGSINSASDTYPDVAVANNANNVSILLGTPFYNVQPQAVSAVEGVTFPNTTSLLTFQYDNSPAVGNFNADVNDGGGNGWGDSTTTLGLTPVSNGASPVATYTVQAGHKYSDPGAEGTKNISIILTNTTDSQTFSVTPTSTPAGNVATVVDATLTGDNTTPDLPDGGNPHTYTNVLVARWSDQNTTAPTTDFDISIDWGDATVDTCLHPCASITGTPTLFSVTGTHTYSAIGNYPIVTTITDAEGGFTQTATVTIHANITSITPGALNPIIPHPVEGMALANGVVLATFASTNGSGVFNASVTNWGDGASEPASVVNTGPGAYNVVTSSSSHKYADENAGLPVSITINDTNDGSTAKVTSTAIVDDGVIAVTTNSSSIAENSSTVGNIATFTDQNTLTTTAAYTVTIDWGDCGNLAHTLPGVCAVPAPAASVSGSNGSFSVADTHTYLEEGSYTVNVKVVDTDTNQTKTGSGTITVTDAPLSSLVVNAVAGGGTGFGGELVANVDTWNGTLATWSDANTVAPTTDFTVSVDWGDGTALDTCAAPCAKVQTNGGGGLFKLVTSHMFAKAGSQLTAIKVTVTDIGGAPVLGPVSGTAATVTSLNGGAPQAITPKEGVAFTNSGVAAFTSQRAGAVTGDFTVTGTKITWGDTTSDTAPSANITVTGAAPNFTVNGSHTYAEETTGASGFCSNAPCAITVNITDNVDGSTLTVTGSTATVGDAALAASTVTQLGPVNEGTALSNVQVLQFTDANINAPTTDFTAGGGSITINWGDGNSDTTPSANVSIASGGCVTTATAPFTPTACAAGAFHLFNVSGTHTYTEGGLHPLGACVGASPNATCQINVTVVDEGGSNITAFNSTSALVADAPLSSLVVNPVSGGGTGQGGTLVSNKDTWNGTLATWSDGNTSAPTTDFTVSVDWGDGGALDTCTAPCAKVQANGGPGLFKLVTSHVFLKAGTQLTPITVTVTDIDGAPALGPTPGTAAVVTSLDFPPTPQALTPKEGEQFTNSAVLGFLSHRAGAATGDFLANTTSVAWGDGGTDTAPSANLTVAGAGAFTLQGTHTYAEENPNLAGCGANCTLTITVKDNIDGSTLTAIATSTATVGDAPLAASTVAQLGPVQEGTALTNALVLQFTDGNVNAPLTDFTTLPNSITVDWGDGTPVSAGTIADGGCVTTANAPFTPTACAAGTFHLFNVTGTHTYAESGLHPAGACTPGSPNATCQIKVTVLDEGGSNITAFNSTSALVNDAPLSALVVNPVSGGGTGQGGVLVSNKDTWNGTLATWTDANTSAPTTDFTVSVNWGDGSPLDTCTAPCAKVQSNGGGGLFKLVTSHVFLLAGTQLAPIQVTVTDIDGAPALGPTPGTAAVVTSLDFPPTPQFLTPKEGIAFANAAVLGFLSHRAGAASGDFLANTTSVAWGDGSTDTAPSANLAVAGAGAFTLEGSHKYAEENPLLAGCGASCTLTITVKDNIDGSTLTAITTSTATVGDAPLTPSAVAALPVITEYTPLNNVTVLTFSDGNTGSPACPGAGCDFVATIHWGDGTASAGTVTGPLGGPYTVTGSHTYTDGGLDMTQGSCVAGLTAVCPVTVDITDEGGSTIVGFNGTNASITDAPLSNPVGVAKIVGTLAVTNLGLGTFNDANPGAPPSDFTALIDWGDCGAGGTPGTCGFVSAGTVTGPTGGPFAVSGNHTFVQLSTLFHVAIQVQDKGGAAPVVINSTVTTPTTAGFNFGGAASPPASLVQPGQSIDVLITLSPATPAYTGVVTFTGCSIVSTVPAGLKGPINCTFTPSSVPDVSQIRTVHMFVQTFSSTAKLSAPPRPGHTNPIQLALLLPGFAGVFGMVLLGGSKKSRRRTLLWFGASLLLLALLLVGCGGGGPQITPSPSGNATQAGTYTLQVNMSGPPTPPDIQVSVQVQ